MRSILRWALSWKDRAKDLYQESEKELANPMAQSETDKKTSNFKQVTTQSIDVVKWAKLSQEKHQKDTKPERKNPN